MATTDYVKYNTTLDLAKSIFDNSDGQAYEADRKAEAVAIMLMLGTGYRISDVQDLNWKDIDWRGVTVKGYAVPLPMIQKKLIKTGVKHTAVIWDAEIASRLKAYYEYLKLTFGKSGEKVLSNLNSAGGKVYSRMWIMRRLRQHNEAGRLGRKVETVGAHSLRKAFAMDLYDRTGDVNLVKQALGHKNIATTSEYLNIAQEDHVTRMGMAYGKSNVNF